MVALKCKGKGAYNQFLRSCRCGAYRSPLSTKWQLGGGLTASLGTDVAIKSTEVDRHNGVRYGSTHGHYHRDQQQRVRRQYHANHCWCWISTQDGDCSQQTTGLPIIFLYTAARPPALTNLPVSSLPTPPTRKKPFTVPSS